MVYPVELERGKLDQILKRIGCHPGSVEIFRDRFDIYPVFIPEVKTAIANILKQEMLSSKGDAALHAGAVACRIEKTSVLLLGTFSHYEELLRKLQKQDLPSLNRIAEDLKSLLLSVKDPVLKQSSIRGRVLDYSHPTVMGILNITEDSFYDGGKYSGVEDVVKTARKMVEAGATILDVGGESTRPGAAVVPLEEEVRRVVPVIQALSSEFDVIISIDTTKASVAEVAISAGAEMVNDISGLTFDPQMGELIASTGVLLVLMHIQGRPGNMQQNPHYEDVVGEILAYFAKQIDYAKQCGIDRKNIILDPGIGFGKTLNHNLQILSQLRAFCGFGLPVLIGASRKSMIGGMLNKPVKERLFGTLGVHAAAYGNGASIFRVHDVAEHVDLFKMMDGILTY